MFGLEVKDVVAAAEELETAVAAFRFLAEFPEFETGFLTGLDIGFPERFETVVLAGFPSGLPAGFPTGFKAVFPVDGGLGKTPLAPLPAFGIGRPLR